MWKHLNIEKTNFMGDQHIIRQLYTINGDTTSDVAAATLLTLMGEAEEWCVGDSLYFSTEVLVILIIIGQTCEMFGLTAHRNEGLKLRYKKVKSTVLAFYDEQIAAQNHQMDWIQLREILTESITWDETPEG